MSNPNFETFRKHPAVKGISVGMCVSGPGKQARVADLEDKQAHAHYDPTDRFFGWICVSEPKDLGTNARVSATLMHELAHLLAPLRTHDDRWRRRMRALGQPITAAYQKRVRHVAAN